MISVLNADPFGYSEKAIRTWQQAEIQYLESSWEQIISSKKMSDARILIVRLSRKIDSVVLDRFSNLLFIISAATGTDHIDMAELTKRNIQLFSLKGHDDFLRKIPSTAEHTWGLLLSLVRNIPASCHDVAMGNWNRDRFRGHQIKNQNLGIIGLGRTGSLVASYGKAFGMHIGYYDPNIRGPEDYCRHESLNSLLIASQFISIHVHLTPETEHLLNNENFRYFQPGSFLINTSRGRIIDEDCLIRELTEKRIAGYAADVLYDELLHSPSENALVRLMNKGSNIIITPHIGGATWDAMHMCEEYLADYFVCQIRNS